ncbi:MAG: tetratricopeptide repeat protein [Desulfobacteraceae bacterium]|nr:MAG: tetratricopeptide repeat protein [Desulfobacteraceae bacterium]
MSKKIYKQALSAVLAPLLLLAWCTPGWAISLKEEQELSQQFMRMVHRNFELIDDPLIRDYVGRVGQKILAALPPQPFAYHFYVVKEEVYNAFAIPAGYIFINSGLLLAMDSEEELAGILSHEISHVVCRHISQRIERSKKIDLASMAGVVAGIFLGVAGGSPQAAQALTLGSAAAGQSLSLAYSRDDESQADQMGLSYLAGAGYSANGLLEVLKKIRGKQWFGSDQIPTYMMTHPAVEERIAHIDTWMATQGSASKEKKENVPSTQFRRIQYRLRALYGDPTAALQFFKSALAKNPSHADAAYGYGLTLSRTGSHTQAVTYLQQVLTQNALDPIVLGDLGKIYFLAGRTKDALEILRGAATLPNPNPEGLFYLGRTYIESGDYAAAADSLERLLRIQDDYAPAYYYLGEAYGKLGRNPEAHYFLGMYHFKKGDDRLAYHHLVRAQKEIQDPAKLETIKKSLEILNKLPKEALQ